MIGCFHFGRRARYGLIAESNRSLRKAEILARPSQTYKKSWSTPLVRTLNGTEAEEARKLILEQHAGDGKLASTRSR